MNIFEIYKNKINHIVKNSKDKIIFPENLSSINVSLPPNKFSYDLSSNIAMIISKINNNSPLEMAEKIKKILSNELEEIDNISVAKPGFLNFKFKNNFWNYFLKDVLNKKKYVWCRFKEKEKKLPNRICIC